MAEKKYYWLKLKRDFFKRHDIQIIEAMPNGKDYVLFYLKLLVESVDHNGELRFSDTIPYNEQMLSTITNTNIDIVRSAMKVFSELNMVDVYDDQTIFLAETEKMLGSEGWSAERMRRLRANPQLASHCDTDVTNGDDTVTKSKIKSKSIDKDIDKDISSSQSDFDVFWKAYPRKVGKDAARKSFAKAKTDLQTILSAIEAQKKSEQWTKDNGQFIPHPATWLNQGRWQDELETDKPVEQEKPKPKKYRPIVVNGETVMEEVDE